MDLTQKNQIKGLSTRREQKALRALCRLSENIYSVGLYEVSHNFLKTPALQTYNSNLQSGKHRENCQLLHSGTSQQAVKVAELSFRLFFTLIEGVKAAKFPPRKVNLSNLLARKADFDLRNFSAPIEVSLLGKAWRLSACRFGNYTELKRKNAGIPRSGRAKFAPPSLAGTRSALRGRAQGRPPAGLKIFLPAPDAVCGLACLNFYMPALPNFKKQCEPGGKDGKYRTSIQGWYKKEKVKSHRLLDKQKLGHFGWRKVGADSAIYCAFNWRISALPALGNKKRAGRIQDLLNQQTERLIINSSTARKRGAIRGGGPGEQKQEIRGAKRCGRHWAQIQIASLRERVKASGAGVAARLSERERAGKVGAKQKGEKYGNFSPRFRVLWLRPCEAICGKEMLLSELRYGSQYADREADYNSQASFSNRKLSQGRTEAHLSDLLEAVDSIFGVSSPSRQEQFIGDQLPRKSGEYVRGIKITSGGIGRELCGSKQWLLVSAALNVEANIILRKMYRRLDMELAGARLSISFLESQKICKPAPTGGALKKPFRVNLLIIPALIKN